MDRHRNPAKSKTDNDSFQTPQLHPIKKSSKTKFPGKQNNATANVVTATKGAVRATAKYLAEMYSPMESTNKALASMLPKKGMNRKPPAKPSAVNLALERLPFKSGFPIPEVNFSGLATLDNDLVADDRPSTNVDSPSSDGSVEVLGVFTPQSNDDTSDDEVEVIGVLPKGAAGMQYVKQEHTSVAKTKEGTKRRTSKKTTVTIKHKPAPRVASMPATSNDDAPDSPAYKPSLRHVGRKRAPKTNDSDDSKPAAITKRKKTHQDFVQERIDAEASLLLHYTKNKKESTENPIVARLPPPTHVNIPNTCRPLEDTSALETHLADTDHELNLTSDEVYEREQSLMETAGEEAIERSGSRSNNQDETDGDDQVGGVVGYLPAWEIYHQDLMQRARLCLFMFKDITGICLQTYMWEMHRVSQWNFSLVDYWAYPGRGAPSGRIIPHWDSHWKTEHLLHGKQQEICEMMLYHPILDERKCRTFVEIFGQGDFDDFKECFKVHLSTAGSGDRWWPSDNDGDDDEGEDTSDGIDKPIEDGGEDSTETEE